MSEIADKNFLQQIVMFMKNCGYYFREIGPLLSAFQIFSSITFLSDISSDYNFSNMLVRTVCFIDDD